MKAPSIHVLTPSGRFQINTKICMSMSDFHPECWNPLWSVATIIQGVQSFMVSDELTTGGLKASESDRKKFAKLSIAYNQKNYPKLFEGNIQAALEAADQACQKSEKENAKSSASGNDQKSSSSRRSRRIAKKAASFNEEKSNPDAERGDDDDGDNNEENKSATTTELSPEEIERRRKRNAKKRAKQKAKKAATVTTQEEGTDANEETR